jgi:TonB family protein
MTAFIRFSLVAMLALAAASQALADAAPELPGCGSSGLTKVKIPGPHAMPPEAYPLVSVVQGEQGIVHLRFTIQPDGSVSDPHVVKSSGYPRLDEAAMENVTAWRYGPSEKDGKPVACLWDANVDWLLNNAAPVFPNNAPFGIVRLGPSDYPASALRRKETGAAAFIIALGKDGKQIFAVMVHTSGYTDLDGASNDYVKTRLVTKPAEIDGKPVESLIDVVLVWSPEATPATNP